MRRKEKLADIEEVCNEFVKDGCHVGIGGFQLTSRPMSLVRQIIRSEIENLTIISPPAGLDVDLLVASGCVKELIVPYVGAETLVGIGPAYRRAVEKGELSVKEYDTGMILTGLKAAAEGLPFLPSRSGVGTSLLEINNDIKEFKDPLIGEALIAVPALKPDVTIIHAGYSDEYGNVQHVGSTFMDNALVRAARHVVVQVERVIPNERIRVDPTKTTIPSFYVDAVSPSPYGAHPMSSPGFYTLDREHLTKDYIPASKAWMNGIKKPMEAYLSKYITSPRDDVEYLELIGLRRLLSLAEAF